MTREEAIDVIKHNYPSVCFTDLCKAVDMAIKALEQPELIRCGKCKHSEHWYKDKTRCFLWHEDGIDVFEDGFCNYAERRTDEKNT